MVNYNWHELEETNDRYVIRTKDTHTGSKIKYFLKWWPEAYYLKYVLCVNPPYYEEKPKRYFIVGNAFDDIVQIWPEEWKKKYWIDTWMLVWELRTALIETGKYKEEDLKWIKKDELQDMYGDGRIRLTGAEWRDVLGMYREAMRQPSYDAWWEYERQYFIEAEYQGLKISWTLDRFSKDKALIRDDKTTAWFDFFEYNLETKLWYLTSMSFYYLLALASEWVSCDVILDVLGKKQPYWYLPYKLDKQKLRQQIEEKIKPWFEALNKCYETWIRESVYPIDYYTEDKYGNIDHKKAWDPIPRTTLMNNEYYPVLKGTICDGEFIEPVIL